MNMQDNNNIKSDEMDEMKDKIEYEFINNQYTKWRSKANKYIDDKSKLRDLLNNAMEKMNNRKSKGPLKEIWDRIQLLFGITRDWIRGTYKEVKLESMIMIVIGLLYFVTPLDIIPDWLIGLGWVDDAFILGLIIRQLDNELESYKAWKNKINDVYYEVYGVYDDYYDEEEEESDKF